MHRARTSIKKIDKLIGLTTFHRMTSWISALTYGNFPLSRILTTLMPTTRSISSWALTCFSGCSAIRRINVNTVAYVFKKKLHQTLIIYYREVLTVSTPPPYIVPAAHLIPSSMSKSVSADMTFGSPRSSETRDEGAVPEA